VFGALRRRRHVGVGVRGGWQDVGAERGVRGQHPQVSEQREPRGRNQRRETRDKGQWLELDRRDTARPRAFQLAGDSTIAQESETAFRDGGTGEVS